MNVYTTTDFPGHWPVGVAAVVVANDENEAHHLMREALDPSLRPDENHDFEFQRLDVDRPNAVILHDGEY